MSKLRAAAIAAIILSVLAFSCWAPPFDPALSTSAWFEKKTEHVLSIGPLRYESVKAKDSYFVPISEAYPTDGYWASREDDSILKVYYVNTASGNPRIGPMYQFEDNNYGKLNAVQGMSPATANTPLISPTLRRGAMICGTGATNLTTSRAILGLGLLTVDSWNEPPVPLTPDAYTFDALGSDSLWAIGGSIQRFNPTISSRNLLLAGEVSGSYTLVVDGYIVQPHESPYGNSILFYNPLNYPGPHLMPGTFYYCDGFYDLIIGVAGESGDVVAYRWEMANRGALPVVLSFDAQITDVLHDGTLLARGKTATGAYTSSGKKLYSIPTGSYRFIHELHDGITYYSYFTRTIIVPDNKDDWKGQVYFDVVRCPTAELPSIGG